MRFLSATYCIFWILINKLWVIVGPLWSKWWEDHSADIRSSKSEREGRKTGWECLRPQCSSKKSSSRPSQSHPVKSTIRASPPLLGTDLSQQPCLAQSRTGSSPDRVWSVSTQWCTSEDSSWGYQPHSRVIRDMRRTFSWLLLLA